MKSGAVTISAMQPSERKVRIYGEAAVIVGQSTITAKVGEREETGEFRFTDVWARRGNSWQAVASQVTRITKP